MIEDKKPQNPSAFPSDTIDHRESAMQSRTVYNGQEEGMTLRDYFAAAALTGLCAYSGTMNDITLESTALRSYDMADEMLKQREL